MKTMSKLEVNQMIRSLPVYHQHLETNPKTFLAKIYGIFSIRIDQFETISVMIMQNTLPNVPHTELSYVFDMKGSSIKREVLKGVENRDLKPTHGKVLKDLDYLRLKEVKSFMKMDECVAKMIVNQLDRDVKFLNNERYMDYSLLLGIKRVNPHKDTNFKSLDLMNDNHFEEREHLERISIGEISNAAKKEG
jgi:1-phosphatidylinositol-4-phosphate 5-kinase